MAVRMTKPWRPLTLTEAKRLSGNLGVYELSNDEGEVVFIGAATGRSLYGLRGEVMAKAEHPPAGATQFRVEVNTAYRTRHGELLAVYMHDHGRLPVANTDVDPKRLGRLSPG
ncbi:MAG: DUF7508 domain-containing protein [Alphaproteobacteria bacterium]|jgi:hypothetical protein